MLNCRHTMSAECSSPSHASAWGRLQSGYKDAKIRHSIPGRAILYKQFMQPQTANGPCGTAPLRQIFLLASKANLFSLSSPFSNSMHCQAIARIRSCSSKKHHSVRTLHHHRLPPDMPVAGISTRAMLRSGTVHIAYGGAEGADCLAVLPRG